MSQELLPQQIQFCEEYILDFNATQAYIRAGYSPNGCRPSAFRLLRDNRVKAYIKAKLEEIGDRRDELRASLMGQWEEQASMDIDTDEDRYKWPIKLKSQELLGKALGMFSERLELTGRDGGPIETKFDTSKLTDSELQTLLAITEKLETPDIPTD